MFAVIRLHDEKSEGLSRRHCIAMVKDAGGGELTSRQAENLWDNTVFRLGQQKGLLCGYVKPQDGTSKRTAAGKKALQQSWYDVVTKVFEEVRRVAMEVLQDEVLVEKLMPWLVANLDEECLQALGKNYKVAGSKGKKKHNNQNASSRCVVCHVPRRRQRVFFFFCLWQHPPGGIFIEAPPGRLRNFLL